MKATAARGTERWMVRNVIRCGCRSLRLVANRKAQHRTVPLGLVGDAFEFAGRLLQIGRLDDVETGPWRRERIHRSEEHTSELQSLMRISYAVFCLKKQKQTQPNYT